MISKLGIYFAVHFAFRSAISVSGQTSSPNTDPPPDSIPGQVKIAKDHGETSITIRAPNALYEQINSLGDALNVYEVITATPVAWLTQMVDGYHIVTWYKLKVGETLIKHPNNDVPAVSIPSSLSPVRSDEIVVSVPQGSMTIDEIKVTVTGPDSRLLDMQKRYLFFLSPDSSGHFAFLRVGPSAIYSIAPDGTFAPLVEKQSRLQQDVSATTGRSLDVLRQTSKTKAAARQQQ